MDVAAVGPDDEKFVLALLNTTPVMDGEARDDLAQPKVARAWMRAHGIASTSAELAALLDARAVLQAVVRGEQTPIALQRFVASVALRPTVSRGGVDWRWRSTGPLGELCERCSPGMPFGSSVLDGYGHVPTRIADCF
jgi:hypothetical protein